jgi:hypothetical protein
LPDPSCFIFFPTAQKILKFCHRTNGTFAKPHQPTLKPSFAKEPFLANAPKTDININHKVKIPYFDRLK